MKYMLQFRKPKDPGKVFRKRKHSIYRLFHMRHITRGWTITYECIYQPMRRITIDRNSFRVTKMMHMYSQCQSSWPLTYPTSIDSRVSRISGDSRCTHASIRRIYAGSKTEWCVSNINTIVAIRITNLWIQLSRRWAMSDIRSDCAYRLFYTSYDIVSSGIPFLFLLSVSASCTH